MASVHVLSEKTCTKTNTFSKSTWKNQNLIFELSSSAESTGQLEVQGGRKVVIYIKKIKT